MGQELEVSLVKYLCPICGEVAEEGILMNSLLSRETAEEVKKLHNKAVGFADHACKKCAEYKNEVVYFVSIDPDKCVKEDIYRTGQIVGVRKHSQLAEKCAKYKKVLKDGTEYCLISEKAGGLLGLWNIT